MRILVTGPTGYIGGRLVPRLLDAGHDVRVLARDAGKLADVPWFPKVTVVTGDVGDPAAMAEACADIDTVYYLVHSLSRHDFAAIDRHGALIVAQAAREAGVRQIIYLGGLQPATPGEWSEHLASRAEVGEIFLRSGVPSVVLQAAVILGSGSASFEMLRYLTERLPVMVTPRWVDVRVQPIAVRDVLHYLLGALDAPAGTNRTFDIGGPEVLTYRTMMQRYARVTGLKDRAILRVPLLTPRLSAHWVNVVTPVPRALAAPLVESLVHEMVCREQDIRTFVPDPPGGLTGYDRAVELALARVRAGEVETRWSDAATVDAPSDPLPSDPDWSGGSAYVDRRVVATTADPDRLWAVVMSIGGQNGWYSFPLAWAVRGWLDRLVGGVGLRRGRRNPNTLMVGEALDWWRVEALDDDGPDRLLRLRAEMRVPGRAWLELAVSPGPAGQGAELVQRAVFVPRGLAGHMYWWSVSPFHGVVFAGMARNLTLVAEHRQAVSP